MDAERTFTEGRVDHLHNSFRYRGWICIGRLESREAFQCDIRDVGIRAFRIFLRTSFVGWRSGMRTAQAARNGALKFCLQNGKNCDVRFVDDTPAP